MSGRTEQARQPLHSVVAPATLAALAMTMPLMMAAEPAAASARPTVLAVSQDRADALVRCVGQAARQWYAAKSHWLNGAPAIPGTGLAGAPPCPPIDPLQPTGPAHLPRQSAPPVTTAGLLTLIDLPPPTC